MTTLPGTGVGVGLGVGAAVVNEKTKFEAIWSGGSSVSESVICVAATFTVQVVFCGRSEVGSNVNVAEGDPVCEIGCGVPVGQSIVNALLVALTLSLKVIVMLESIATFVAPSTGLVVVTDGAISPPPVKV